MRKPMGEETKAKIRAALQGRKRPERSEEWKKNMSIATKGKEISLAHREKLRAALLGRVRPPRSTEWSANLSAATTGRKLSAVHKKNIGLAGIGKHSKKRTPEQCERIAAAKRGSTHASPSLATRLKLSVSQKGRVISSAHRAKLSASVRQAVLDGRVHPRNKNFHYAGTFFRSSWEVIFAQWCDARGIVWEYESLNFSCRDGTGYLPDFYLPVLDAFVEVKGFLRPESVARMDEFVLAGYRLFIIDRENINDIILSRGWVPGLGVVHLPVVSCSPPLVLERSACV